MPRTYRIERTRRDSPESRQTREARREAFQRQLSEIYREAVATAQARREAFRREMSDIYRENWPNWTPRQQQQVLDSLALVDRALSQQLRHEMSQIDPSLTISRRPGRPKEQEDFDLNQLRLDTLGWRILLLRIENWFDSQARERAARNYHRILASHVELEPFSTMEEIPFKAHRFTRGIWRL
jgi:hypothetical protein